MSLELTPVTILSIGQEDAYSLEGNSERQNRFKPINLRGVLNDKTINFSFKLCLNVGKKGMRRGSRAAILKVKVPDCPAAPAAGKKKAAQQSGKKRSAATAEIARTKPSSKK